MKTSTKEMICRRKNLSAAKNVRERAFTVVRMSTIYNLGQDTMF